MPDTVLCKCGSGLRQVRCCDLDQGALPEAVSLEMLDPMASEATKLFNAKKAREAETLVLKLLDLAPNHRLAIRLLFELRKAQENRPATEILGRRLAALPGNAAQASAANLMLAQWLIGQGRHAAAEAPARLAVKNAPRDVTAHHVMGVVFTETGKLRKGEHHYRRALELHGAEDGTMLGNLAWNLKLQGRLAEAARYYQQALTIRPDNLRAIGGYAQVEAAIGNTAHAAMLLDNALSHAPGDRSLRLLRTLLELTEDQPEAALGRLSGEPGSLLPPELIARGQAYLRLGQNADAVAAFSTAKKLQRERFGRRHDDAALIEQAKQYQLFFSADRLSALPRTPTSETLQPVFLLGFPGSGTSLLEQLLAKLPGFIAADGSVPIADLLELPELENYPDCLSEFLIGDGQTRLRNLRRHYLDRLADRGFMSDKYPYVTLRAASDFWHLGLIRLLFPEAPIIHLLRHPLDIVSTNFSRDKKLEADAGISLAALAAQYDLTMSMLRHYRGQLTLRYLPVRFEALIDDPVAAIRQILEFIGIRTTIPDETELRANRAVPAGITPSHAVAQRAIDRSGVEGFRRFEAVAPDIFASIRPALAPWIDALGYTA